MEEIAAPPEEKATPDPLKGLKKANKTLQTERDGLRTELDTLKKSIEDAKRTDAEKVQAEIKAMNDRLAALANEASAAKKALDRERKISQLVSKHKLADPEYGDLVLQKYNPDEHEDFDQFVGELRKAPTYARLFEQERILDDGGNEIIPRAPSGTAKKPGSNLDALDREFAISIHPNDKKLQDELFELRRALRKDSK